MALGTGRPRRPVPPEVALPFACKTALAAVVSAGLLGSAGCGEREAPRTPAPGVQVALDEVTWSEFAGAHLARRVRAERLVVVPRRMGALQLSPVSELVVTRPAFELFEAEAPAGLPGAPGAPGTPGRAPAAGPPAAARGSAVLGLGAVRRLVAATFFEPTFTLVRGGAPVARLEAGRARADVRSRDVVLSAVRLEHLASGRRLTADRAVWLADEETLRIDGDYVLSERGARTGGRGLRVDAWLRAAPSARRGGAPLQAGRR